MNPFYRDAAVTLYQGHALKVLAQLEAESVQCCVTSPPYWGLRDYGVQAVEWPEVSYAPMPGLSHAYVDPQTTRLGHEPTPAEYVAHLVAVFREVRRVLRDDGTLWLNLGYSYAGSRGNGSQREIVKGSHVEDPAYKGLDSWRPPTSLPSPFKRKDLVPIPWMVALAMQADGWYLRSDVIWAKSVSFCPTYNGTCKPESVKDRPTKAHEYVLLFSKNEHYYYDQDAVREPLAESTLADVAGGYGWNADAKHDTTLPGAVHGKGGLNDPDKSRADILNFEGRNLRTVWTVNPGSYGGAHFATFPPDLIRPMIRAGSRPGDTVLDPFAGTGTTGQVAVEERRKALLIELSVEYCAEHIMARFSKGIEVRLV